MNTPQTMRAMALARVGGPEHIVETNLPVPEPAGDEVLIRVRTVAVNHQDLFTMSGRAHKANLSFPHVMGIDPSGVVAGCGSRVTSLRIGQRVVVKPPIACHACDFCDRGEDDSCPSLHNVGVHRWGGHAEYVTVPERSVFPIAAGVAHAEATALAHSFPVAEQMFTRVGLTGDDVVLVSGASGAIGSAAVQLAKLAGAFVIGAAGSPDRTARAAMAGADATIDYSAEPEFSGRMRGIAPEGVTIFLDPASNPSVWGEGLKDAPEPGPGGRLRVACRPDCPTQQQLAVPIARGDLWKCRVHPARDAAVSRSGGSRPDRPGDRLGPAPQQHPRGVHRPWFEAQLRQDRAARRGWGRTARRLAGRLPHPSRREGEVQGCHPVLAEGVVDGVQDRGRSPYAAGLTRALDAEWIAG